MRIKDFQDSSSGRLIKAGASNNLIGKLTAVNILSPLSESTYGKLYAADEILEILQ